MEILKRFLSALLALALVAGMLPVSAIATEADIPAETTQTETVPPETAPEETIPTTTGPEQTAAEAAAEETEPAVTSLEPITIVHVNPLYEGVADDTPVEIPALMTLSDSYLTDAEEMAEILRDCMEERESYVTIPYRMAVADYSDEAFSELVHDAMDRAMAHTGEPTQGDYLKWQYQTWQVSASASGDGRYWYFNLNFYIVYSTTAAQEAEMDTAVAKLLNQLNPTGSDYDKLRTVYDYMTENIRYDYTNLNNSSYYLKHTAYAALINRTSVCQGYAVLLYRLALELGIDCRVITGRSQGEGHGWNIVELDGKYYNADATWDASRIQAGVDYIYFLRSEANFADHTRDADFAASAFYSKYPMATADYVPGQEPEETVPPVTEPEESGIPGFILTDGLSIRSEPGVEGSIVGRYSYGEMVSIYEISGEWGRTDRGWITMDSVDTETPEMKEPERALRRQINSGIQEISVTDEIVLVKALEIPGGIYVYFEEGGSLTVPAGLSLDVGGYLSVYDGALIVEENGILTVSAEDWAVIDIWGGSLDVTGADISGVPANAIRVLLNSSTVRGISRDMLYGDYLVSGSADVSTALAEASQYGYMQLDPVASFTLERSITIPQNTLWNMYFSSYEVVIPAGVTVTNNGDIWVQNGNLLIFEEGSRLVNNGYLYVDSFSELLMFGSFADNGITNGYITGSTMSQGELEEFLAASDGYGWIHSTETTLTRNMTVNVPFGLYRYGRLIVPSGVTLTFNSEVLLYEGGEILVEDGGELIINAAMENYGTVTIAEGGSLRYTGTWTGNAPNQAAHTHSYIQTVTKPTCTTRGYTTYSCDCGHSYAGDYVEAAGHSMGEWTVSIQPACEAKGEERRDCGNCEHYETRWIDAPGHTEVIDKEAAATCTESGLTEGKHCSVCDKILTPREVIPAKGHSFGDWYETKAPSTEAEGEERRDCASCDEFETRAVEKLTDDTPDDEITLPFTSYEWEVLKLTNKERLAAGLNPLTGLDVMQEAAHIRAEELTQYFSHTRPNGTRCFTVLEELGIYYYSAAENIAYGYGTPAAVVNGWMNSEGHRANILTASLSHMGVGETANRWVQLFIGSSTYSSIKVIVPQNLSVEPGMTIEDMNLVAILTAKRHGDSYLPVTDAYCQGYDANRTGDQTVTVSVLGVSTSITLHIHNWQTLDCADGTVCTECGARSGSGQGHEMGDWEETKAPTCEEAGEECRRCSECAYYESREIPAMGHDYTAAVTEPTCEARGYTTYTCGCGHSYAGDYVDALGHDYGDGKVTTQPDCENEGVRSYTCANDKTHTYTETIPARGHTEVIDKAVAATCTATGLTEGKHCSVCGKVLTEQKELPAIGHAWDQGVVTIKPGCETEGVRIYLCANDLDHTCTEAVPALGHTAVTDHGKEATCTETGLTEGSHCAVCDAVLTERQVIPAKGHEKVTDKALEATCTGSGLSEGSHCAVCGKVLTEQKELPAKGHAWDEGIVTLEPTEETTGIRLHSCKDCGMRKEDTIPTLEHVHQYTAAVTDPTCTGEGFTTYTCPCGDSYVSDRVEAPGHDYGEGIILTEPGCETEGVRTYVCANDAAHTGTEILPPLGHSFGDWYVTKEATTEVSGEERRDCDSCEYSEIRVTELATSGSCGENLTWEFAEGVLTISGYGEMYAYCGPDPVPWEHVMDQIREVQFDDRVTSIGYGVFRDCVNLTRLRLPDDLELIAEYAFSGCTGLTGLVLPDDLELVGTGAFTGCTGLTSVTTAADHLEFAPSAFALCTSLSRMTFTGDAVDMDREALLGVTATAYYPADNDTWTDDVLQSCGGDITWVPYTADSTPDLSSNSITLNPMAESGTQVTLVGSYYNDIVRVWIADSRFATEYDFQRGILTITAAEAMKNGSVSTWLNVECADGETYGFDLKITVKSTVPSLSVKQNEKLDLFYVDSEATLTVTARDSVVEKLELTDTDDFSLEGNVLRFTDSCVEKYQSAASYKPDTRATLLVYVEGCRYPIQKELSIGTTTSKVSLVSDPASSAVNTALSSDKTTSFGIRDKSTKTPVALTAANVVDVTGSFVDSWTVEDGEIVLTVSGSSGGSAEVLLRLDGWMQSVKVTHKVTIDTKLPTAKLASSNLKLSSVFPTQTAETTVALSHGNLTIERFGEDNTFTGTGDEAAKLQVSYDGKRVTARIIDPNNVPKAGSYTFTATPYVGGEPLKPLTVKVTVSGEVPKVKLNSSVKLNTKLAAAEMAEIDVTLENKTGYNLTLVGFKGTDSYKGVDLDYRDGKLYARLLSGNTGKYDFQLIPIVSDGQGATAELAPVKLSVQAYEKEISISQSGKGKLDTIAPDSAIVYTIGKVSNALGEVTDVDLAEGGEFFDLSFRKDTQTFTLTLKDGVTYDTKQAYQIRLKYTVCGQEVLSGSIKLKVTQSSLKVTAPTAYYFLSQSVPLNVRVTLESPAGAKLEKVTINTDKTAKELVAALGLEEELDIAMNGRRSANLSLPVKYARFLTPGKTYKLVLDIVPIGQADNARLTQINVTVKVGR